MWGLFSVSSVLQATPANLESSLHLGFSQIEAETGTLSPGVEAGQDDSGHGIVSGLSGSEWIGFERVFFEEAGARSFDVRVRTNGAEGTLAIRIGGPTGPTIGRVDLAATDDWQTVRGSIWRVSGIQPVYLALESGADATLDWIRFQPEPLITEAKEKQTPLGAEISEAVPPPTDHERDLIMPEVVSAKITAIAMKSMDPNRLEAEDAQYSKDLKTRTAEDGTVYLDAIRARSWIMYPQIQYGRSGKIRIRLSHYARGDSVEIRLGSRHAKPLAQTFLSVNPQERDWIVLDLDWADIEPGRYDTYIVFRGTRERMFSDAPESLFGDARSSTVNRKIAQLDWISLDSQAVNPETLTASR